MSLGTFIHHFVVANVLTLFYSAVTLLVFVFQYIKNPFGNPWAVKLKLEPPAPLSDPKYGVHKYLKVNNIMLHYLESGDNRKPLIIFVHGFPEFWYSWRHQIIEFKKNYWCIAIDLRGYADSEKPEGISPYQIDNMVEDIRDLLRQMGREKCILISHDWGGIIAYHYLDKYPETLSALVTLSSTSRHAWYNDVWSKAEQRKKSWYIFLFRMPAIPEKLIQMYDLEMLEQMMLVPGKDSVSKEDIECYKYWFRKQYTLTPPINYYRANFRYALPEKKMSEAKVPILAVQASDDKYLSRSLLEALKKEYKNVETAVIENCGHFMQQEEPEKVNKLLADFLNRQGL